MKENILFLVEFDNRDIDREYFDDLMKILGLIDREKYFLN